VTRRAAVWWSALLAATLASSVTAEALAAPTTNRHDRFAAGVKALQRGAFDQAIDEFELLADHGHAHPDASFNRGVAYVVRARSPEARAGDFGRAAAGFSEALSLRPGDAGAERALQRVREEIARRRAREGAEPIATEPSLARAVVGLLSEGAWGSLAALGSLLLSVGLVLRLFSRTANPQLAGAIAGSIGAVLLLVTGSLAAAAGHYRRTSQPAVVVVSQARLLDDHGIPVKQVDGRPEHVAIPEGAGVYLLERQGNLAQIEWGTTRAWVSSAQIRVIATP
jgi:hypothetical protein